MSEISTSPNRSKVKYHPTILWVQGITSVLIIIALVLWYYSLNSKIKENNELVQKNITALKEKYRGNEYRSFIIYPDKKDREGNFRLSSKDFEEIKQHINYLTKEVDDAVKNSDAQVQLDIDRLNLYMTIAIGLLGFLGIFFPLVSNFVSSDKIIEVAKEAKQDIDLAKSRLEECEKKLSSCETGASSASQKADDAFKRAGTLDVKVKGIEIAVEERLKEINNASNKVEEVVKDIEKAQTDLVSVDNRVKNLEVILLQNALTRIFNLDSYQMQLHRGNTMYLQGIFEKIKLNFKLCADRKINHKENELLKQNIEDFIQSLQKNQFFTISDNRAGVKHFEDLGNVLNAFLKNTTNKTLEELYNDVIIQLDLIINSFSKETVG